MATPPRTEAQRAASRKNGARGTGPRSSEGRIRSSANRVVHGLNSVRLLLATEDATEYQQHLEDWMRSLSPATAAEHQVVLLVSDLMWRLKRVERIEQRRALMVLDDLVEQTPEWATRARAEDVTTALDTMSRMVSSSPLPVPTSSAGAFLSGVRGVENLLDRLRNALAPSLWPEAEVCAFLATVKKLAGEIDAESLVSTAFVATGAAAAALASAVRGLKPTLDAAVDKARAALSTETLLADDEDRRFERHRRLLEASIARQLDLLAKVRAVARPATSGSFERAPPVELRVIRG